MHFGKSDFLFTVALLSGTAAGLIVKYMLDKRWIFYDRVSGLKNNARKFIMYTSMGTITTLIFWGFETLFWFVFKSDVMRDFGAIIGLSIGYIAKYKLDKRFVFSSLEVRLDK